ncbi:cytochrome oxidase subunit III [Flavobacterium cyanobacteriorum]|uniref:Cytochrome oxidase subunit III n=1 Tax=Flavobacterium cyanobacteriorum TaxID=2022802 RepID=A0A255Z9U3_9FLAO|nr:cytochrome c oxidase subunit 3 [Flavobacterium cyanobacteriorum]OYQ38181.1 cytochrome oxidase subunit III [Flavobacterium cyanobacteriorum]
MEMSLKEHYEKKARSQKMMLWFGMVSMFMMFAGLTSAYVVSTSRPDWINDFKLPPAFMVSTVIIILSSITFHFAKTAIQKGNRGTTSAMLAATLVLGIFFVVCQFIGFGEVIKAGYFFTGPESTVTTSFLYIVTVVHLAHLVAGLIVLLVVIYNHFKQKYKPSQTLGIELGAMFWHFLDILWVYLFLFFYFF